MSELSHLKSRIEALAQQATSTGGHLAAFNSTFGQAIAEVSGTIGGSAQRKDQEVIARLAEAQAKVEAAVAALDAAARTAQAYGRSL